MRLLRFLLPLLCTQALAAPTKSFQVNAELQLNGHLISHGQLSAAPFQLASHTARDNRSNKEAFLEMVASDYSTDQAKDQIMMKFVVGYFNGGKREVLATPTVVASEGEESKIEIRPPDGPAVQLKVTAQRSR